MVETLYAPTVDFKNQEQSPEVLHVVSNRMVGKNPTGGMSEAVNQALRQKNGNGHAVEIPELKIWTGWDGKIRLRKPRQPYIRKTVKTPSGVSFETIGTPLLKDEYDNYYLGYSNEVLWPLNHGYPEKCGFDEEERVQKIERYWESYKAVNRKDAAIIAKNILRMADENPAYKPMVWYQDYHKILGAKYLREELRLEGMPDENMPPMALFMHTPIATREDFSQLPEHHIKELLEGYLSYDLLGFHTEEYLKDFHHTVNRFLRHLPGATALDTPDGLAITYNGRRTIVGIFPIGIDPEFLTDLANEPNVINDAKAIQESHNGRKMIFNAARRDYMKGFPEALEAIDALFNYHPEVRGNVVYIQGDQPSRGGIQAYDEIGPIITNKVSQISDRYKTDDWPVPIERYVNGFTRELMLSRLKVSDILFVSSTRDGFCLVPLEYIHLNEVNGVPVVSDRIGAASIYDEAMLTVNIFNPRETAEGLHYAYNMPLQEKIDMQNRGRDLIEEYNVLNWAGRQLTFMRKIRTGRLAA